MSCHGGATERIWLVIRGLGVGGSGMPQRGKTYRMSAVPSGLDGARGSACRAMSDQQAWCRSGTAVHEAAWRRNG